MHISPWYFCPGLPRWAGTSGSIHPLTHILINKHHLSTSLFYYDPQQRTNGLQNLFVCVCTVCKVGMVELCDYARA